MDKMAVVPKRVVGNLILDKTSFFCCDIQEKFRPVIKYFDDIVLVSKRLVSAASILDSPLVVTEQYPKGLGKTVAELEIDNAVGVFPKTKFTMLIPEVKEAMTSLCGGTLEHIILFGIEAHVCVQQTALDLLSLGYDVHVVADAVSSRSQMDRQFAFERLRQAGAVVTTSEAVLLQLVGDKEHAKFKDIQSLIKTSAPVSGLVSQL
ncbi:unnamed protein product [Owenia fusiformis]|uniref:Isochorismatase domain-containing protein 1 n=1 Tax=Owenia fusiformis TaxID=6347 RepID=A0A8J1UKV7_OWEFU|nr:unnamed protein product [Owenia fusiformis]